MRKFNKTVEIETKAVVRGVEVELLLTVGNIDLGHDSHKDLFGTVDTGFDVYGFEILDVKIYSPRKKSYVEVSESLKKVVKDYLEDDSDFSYVVCDQITGAYNLDPDYLRDVYFKN